MIFDADAHLMETPDLLVAYADPSFRDRVNHLFMGGRADFATEAVALARQIRGVGADAATAAAGLAEAEALVLQRKNWWALGAFDAADRSRALDVLGFDAQLIFATHARAVLVHQPGMPPTACADPSVLDASIRAYNRAVADFCRDDRRLLPVGFASLDVPELAEAQARHALELGIAAIELPTFPPAGHAPSHVALDGFYALLAEAQVPIVFHIGSGGLVPDPVFGINGLPVPDDPDGNHQPLRPLRVIGTGHAAELALASLIFDGVLERHPSLRVGVMELGATWLPGFLRRLDLAVRLDQQMRAGLAPWGPATLPLLPSEYVRRQVKFAPFPDEDLAWLIAQTGPELYLFSSDYPHAEGGTDPLGAFDHHLSGVPEATRRAFYQDNFAELLPTQVGALAPAGD